MFKQSIIARGETWWKSKVNLRERIWQRLNSSYFHVGDGLQLLITLHSSLKFCHQGFNVLTNFSEIQIQVLFKKRRRKGNKVNLKQLYITSPFVSV